MMAGKELEPVEVPIECWWPPVKARKVPYMDVWEHSYAHVDSLNGEAFITFIECVTNAPVQLYLRTERRTILDGVYLVLQLIDSRELVHAMVSRYLYALG